MFRNNKIITFTSDFGNIDGYVGAVKGVILSINPSAYIVDIAHDIPAGDVEGASWCLLCSTVHFPPGTIHLAVVDPGVGTERLPVILKSVSGGIFIGPDNGIFYLALGKQHPKEAWVIDPDKVARIEEIPPTFHGRDIFAPAAALISSGIPVKKIAEPINPKEIKRLDFEINYQVDDVTVRGKVIHIDRFGNLITSIPVKFLAIMVDGEVERFPVGKEVSNYNEIKKGQVNFIKGSVGFVEIAASGASAARLTGARKGSSVVSRLKRKLL